MGVDARGHIVTHTKGKDAAFFNAEIKKHFFYWEICQTENELLPFRDNGSIIEINFGMARYYGTGYARGPWPAIATVLEWCRRREDIDEVYYYSDHDEWYQGCGEEISPCYLWTKEKYEEFQELWYTSGSSTYRRNFESIGK